VAWGVGSRAPLPRLPCPRRSEGSEAGKQILQPASFQRASVFSVTAALGCGRQKDKKEDSKSKKIMFSWC